MEDEITITREIKSYNDEERNRGYAELDKEAKKKGVRLKGRHVNLLEELDSGMFIYEFSGDVAED